MLNGAASKPRTCVNRLLMKPMRGLASSVQAIAPMNGAEEYVRHDERVVEEPAPPACRCGW